MITKRKNMPIPVKKIILPSPRIIQDIKYDDKDDNIASVNLRMGTARFEFSMEISDNGICCGMKELGSFSIDTNSTKIEIKNKVKAIIELFDKILEAHIDYRGVNTLIFTLINKDLVCGLVRQAMKDEKRFTLVKSFRNMNSNNINDLYVSNQ